ncbi:hypothetical protein F7725_006578 [Dissostichus mawsoni]|uniref:Uncharacterized protein n=1 Tax=Dissostichus mawsoni TaxID=36200 RepID=A0A7J5XUA3_DISMA|nr:hypothetical protein F7725_006578 [Dissostichus mawsoni]
MRKTMAAVWDNVMSLSPQALRRMNQTENSLCFSDAIYVQEGEVVCYGVHDRTGEGVELQQGGCQTQTVCTSPPQYLQQLRELRCTETTTCRRNGAEESVQPLVNIHSDKMCTAKCSKCIAFSLYPLVFISILCNIVLFFPPGPSSSHKRATSPRR